MRAWAPARRTVAVLIGMLLLVPVLALPAQATTARPHPKNLRNYPGMLHVQVVPAVAGALLAVDGQTARTDDRGRATIAVRDFRNVRARFRVVPTTVGGTMRLRLGYPLGDLDRGASGGWVQVGLQVERRVSWRYVDSHGAPVTSAIDRMKMTSTDGHQYILTSTDPSTRWVPAGRVRLTTQLHFVPFSYRINEVDLAGTNVVNRGQQVFAPMTQAAWTIDLLIFQLRVTTTDWLFRHPVGQSLELRDAGGRQASAALNGTAGAYFPTLSRGSYTAVVRGRGWSRSQPIRVSHDDTLVLTVASRTDLVVIGTGAAVLLGTTLVLGAALGWRRRRAPGRQAVTSSSAVGTAAVVVALVLVAAPLARMPAAHASTAPAGPSPAATTAGTGPPSGRAARSPVPVFAYYYMWYDASSWTRAKRDVPLIGPYSSDDVTVMRRQLAGAKQAGVTGFIVSWKSTAALNRRLAALTEAARAAQFDLEIALEALDFQRRPLPIDALVAAVNTFAASYADDPVFGRFGRPVVVWEGIDQYSLADVRALAAAAGDRVQLVAAAKSPAGYERVAPWVAGEAYYWSSAAADHMQPRLQRMSAAVHRRGQLWLAPAAPGFDARLIGGSRTIPRERGATLRQELEAAYASGPDAIAIISWNEFSENTYIEPSVRYGSVALDLVRDMVTEPVPSPDAVWPGPDSSAESLGTGGGPGRWTVGGVLAALLVAPLAHRTRRRQRRQRPAQRGNPA